MKISDKLLPWKWNKKNENKNIVSLFPTTLNDLNALWKFDDDFKLSENDKEVRVEIKLPDVKKENIEITYIKGFVKIEAKEEQKDKNFWGYKSYSRTISIPEYAEYENAKASFKKGVLKIVLPKNKKELENKKVKLQIK